MWPGYVAANQLVVDGIYLNVDTSTKFINKQTILEIISEQLRRGKSKQDICKEYDSSNLDFPRKTVLTSYNNRSYQIDGLTFD